MAVRVGIAATSVYRPALDLTAAELAELTGIPADVIACKFGLRRKPVAPPDQHVSHLAIAAARPLLQHTDPERVGAVLYFGSPYKDYAVWQVAPLIQHELGLPHAFAAEALNVSCGFPVALKLARGLFAEDPDLQELILVGASVESRLLDYQNQRTRFLFNFADAGAAALLRRGGPNEILSTCLRSDGRFWSDVRVPAGGSVEPASAESVAAGRHWIDVPDPVGMKERLDPVTLPNFARVAREAVARSGHRMEDLALVCPLHAKRSLFKAIMAGLGVPEEKGIYLEEWGHISALDPLIGLHLAQAEGRLRPGDLVLLLSAGTGYTWGATCVRWG